jgi:hypothetical protein
MSRDAVTRYALRALQLAVAAAALGFAWHALSAQWSGVRDQLSRLRLDWAWVALSGVIFLGTYGVLIETWREMLRAWRSSLSFVSAMRIWAKSNLGRYVPGKVWQIGAMAFMAERARVSPIAATGSAVLNTIVNIATGFVVVAALGWRLFDLPFAGGKRAAMILIALGAVGLAVLPLVLPWLLRTVKRLTGRELSVGPLPASAIGVAIVGNVVAWILYGLAFAAFARGILGETHGSLTGYIAVYALSYLVGYLVLLAPAGVGVREASMIALLPAARLADPGQAAILAVTSRLWLTVLEIAPGAFFLGLDGLRRRPLKQ